MEIFLYRNDAKDGPYDLPTILSALANGLIEADIPAWKEGCADWVPLHTLIPAVPMRVTQSSASPGNDVRPTYRDKLARNAVSGMGLGGVMTVIGLFGGGMKRRSWEEAQSGSDLVVTGIIVVVLMFIVWLIARRKQPR